MKVGKRFRALPLIALLVFALGMLPGVALAAEANNGQSLSAGEVEANVDGHLLATQSSFSLGVQATDWTSTLTNNYKNAKKLAGVSSFNGYCPSAVFWQLRSYGILTSGKSFAAGNGHDVVPNYFKSKSKTSGGYSVAYTGGSRTAGWAPCNTATNNGKTDGFYVISYTSTSAPAYGHVSFFIIDGGNVYIAESYTYSGKPEGTGMKFSYSTWKTQWGKTYKNVTGVARLSKDTPQPAKAPSINAPTTVPGGADVKIVDNEGGATVTYTQDGAKGTFTGSKTIRVSKASTKFTAYATKSGRTQSSTASREVKLSTTATPTLKKTDLAAGATVELDSKGNGETIYYTTDGSNPSFNVGTGKATGTKYTSAFSLTRNATVKAIAVRSGELVSGMLTQEVKPVAPEVPSGIVVQGASQSSAKVAVDDAATIKWNENKAAASYVATLYDAAGNVVETSTVKAAQAVFTPSVAGVYKVGIKAVNAIGTSAESDQVEFEAMAPCLVKFVDKIVGEGGEETTEVLDKQLVRYGYNATTPAVPIKRGYTFAGWDRDTPLTNITENNYEIIANWQIKSYTIRFYQSNGKTLIESKSVNYGEKCSPATPPAPEDGYVFTGWAIVEADDDSARDLANVDSNMKLKAVYAWSDQELPLEIDITSAQRNDSSYAVTMTITNKLTEENMANAPFEKTTAWLRVSLKTSADKLVQSSRETVVIPAAGESINRTVNLKYEDSGYVATRAEAEIVGISGDYRTGGAYSKAESATITNAKEYSLSTEASEWSETAPAESADYVIESETQYRYRDKQTTTSTSTSLSGWTRDGTSSTSYSAWSSNKTTTSKPTESDTLRLVGSPSTKYTYYRYCNYYDGKWQQDSIKYGSSSQYHEVTLSSAMTACPNKFGDQGGKAKDLHGPYGSCSHKVSGQSYWWTKSIVTTYTYQTRTKTVSYGYWKWGNWTDWSNERVSSSGNREVETRTVYRTRAKIYNNLTGTEDTRGEQHHIGGTFDSSMDVAGKEATIMVYSVTNSDPNEDQIQYIGQTTIGNDNSYSFDFIPKREPSVETGDFIVSLGVKGSTGLVNVSKIEAPVSEHNVTYLYKNSAGEEVTVSEQTVVNGEAAEVPDPPVVEGEQFQRWSASSTSVTDDMTITALYSTATYAVAWVDWVNGGVFLETKAYGDELTAPVENPVANGYTFVGWDALIDGKTTVQGNTVINAVYEPKMYTVMFSDAAGGVFYSEQVAYGQAATLPEGGPTAEGFEFVAWDTSAGTPWWNVTENMIVKPLFAYEGTVSSPFAAAEIASGYVSAKGTTVFLESATPNSKIYYTTDGSDPRATDASGASFLRPASAPDDGGMHALTTMADEPEEGEEEVVNTSALYDEETGIVVAERCTIRAIAVMDQMNDSSVTEIPVNITVTNDIANADAGVAEAPFFSGEPVEPGVMVWLGDDLLEYDVDYTVEYSDNDQLGVGVATITGKGAYIGTQTVEFDIVEAPEDDESGDSGDTPSGGDQQSGDSASSASSDSEAAGAADGTVATVSGSSYQVASNASSTVIYQKAPKSKKSVTIPAKVTIKGKAYTVVGIAKNAFKGAKAKTVTVKTAKLAKKSVKGCFKGAKKLKTVKVKVGSKKLNKQYVKKYKKIFTKKNCGIKVRVK